MVRFLAWATNVDGELMMEAAMRIQRRVVDVEVKIVLRSLMRLVVVQPRHLAAAM